MLQADTDIAIRPSTGGYKYSLWSLFCILYMYLTKEGRIPPRSDIHYKVEKKEFTSNMSYNVSYIYTKMLCNKIKVPNKLMRYHKSKDETV